jgi:hypothetical protein
MQFLGGLIRAGIADEAGPFQRRADVVAGDLVGLVVFHGHDASEAEEVMRGDPAVASGLMRFEVLPWYP